MRLVREDEYGAFQSVTPAFLEHFKLVEGNPDFEVYDANDEKNRLIFARASRLPDDNDYPAGRHGINFHRARPDFTEARAYHAEMTAARISRKSLNGLAFAAEDEEQYLVKSAAWERFYRYVWDIKPQHVWVTPHSGSVERKLDVIFPYPKLEMDAWVAGAAARCAPLETAPPAKRTMVSLHSHNWYSALVDIGGFGVNDESKLKNVAKALDEKYRGRAQRAAAACREDYKDKLLPWLAHIRHICGTLDLRQLPEEYGIERSVITCTVKGLRLYGREIVKYTLDEFREAIDSLAAVKLKTASVNHLFSGEKVGAQLGIGQRIREGRLGGAVQIEGMKYYLKHEPALLADIILDVERGVFG